jgi:hypothetical protein
MLLLLLALAGGLGLAGLPGGDGERAGASASSSASRAIPPHAVLAAVSTAEQPAPPSLGSAGGPALAITAPTLPLPGFAGLLLLGACLLWVARSIRTGPRQPTGPPFILSR